MPVPGILTVRLTPRFPTFNRKPRPPKLHELPPRLMFHRMPGAILKLRRNRQPTVLLQLLTAVRTSFWLLAGETTSDFLGKRRRQQARRKGKEPNSNERDDRP